MKNNFNKLTRTTLFDELGRKKTLEPSSCSFKDIFGNPISSISTSTKPILILGLGPFASDWEIFIQKENPKKIIYWLESPDFEIQMPQSWHMAIPSYWIKQTIEEVLKINIPMNIYRYMPAYYLFSNFWGPIIGKIQQRFLSIQSQSSSNNTIIFPSSKHHLLNYEIRCAFKDIGLNIITIPTTNTTHTTIFLLKEISPLLFFSINLQGLDTDGTIFRLLQSMHVPVAIWFVDNPWHIISSLRLPWWKEATLFVTDISFISELKRHGAIHVHHLPLAAWKNYREEKVEQYLLPEPILFIGRTAFPNKSQFFSGCNPPELLLKKAYKFLHEGGSPHFHWWVKELGINKLWPGKSSRIAGYSSEHLSLIRRKQWLTKASHLGLTIFGDDAWKECIPNNANFNPPIDYYTNLPQVVKQAKYNLNVTSLLLPECLTQRHFDVWNFGGFLITDTTPGLKIFPKELTEHICISNPNNLINHIEYLEKDPSLYSTLMYAWKEHICKSHTYSIRMQKLLSIMI